VGHEWWTSSFRRQMMTSGRSRECCSARARSVMWWLTLEAAEPGPPQGNGRGTPRPGPVPVCVPR
jgi:hypothetical protein